MALRVPMLLLLSGTFAGGAALTYVGSQLLPDIRPSETAQSETPTVALVTSAEAASKPQNPDPQPVKEASGATCRQLIWPYQDRSCPGALDPAASKPERQVRVISTDRDAPSRVPVPTSVVVAQIQKAAEPEQTLGLGSLDRPEAAPNEPTPVKVAKAEVAKAEASTLTSRVETTSSIRPAAQPASAALRRPMRRQVAVARVERPRRDMSERIRQARRNFDRDEDTGVQTTTYQYADGRQVVFRAESQRPDRRRWFADEPPAPMPRAEPRPARDSIFGWLGQFQD